MQEFRLAARALRASPIVSAVAVISLALGSGANTAIFSLVNSLLLRSLPVVEPERLAMVSASSESASSTRQQYSYATFEQMRKRGDIFDSALAYTDCCGTAIIDANGEPQSVDRQFVSGDFFPTLGVRAFRGRMLTPEDDVPGAPDGPVAVVSYRFWRARLGAREDIVGARLSINRIPVTIVGVMPPSFFGVEVGRVLDLAMPYRLAARFTSSPFDDDTPWLNIMVRLKHGVSVLGGSAGLRAVQAQIRAAAMPAKPRQGFLQHPLTLRAAGLGDSMLRQRFERPLLAVFAVVALVLLVACANVGNLLLARGIARRHEMTVRAALGASRWRLVRQLMAESVLLSTIGAIAGLALTPSATRMLVALLSTAREPIALDLTPHWRVLAFTVATTALTVVIFGLAPAWRATRLASIEALHAQGRGGASHGHVRLFDSLIVAQIVLSLVLVIGAALFAQTFARLGDVSLGFDRDRALVVSVSAPTVPAGERARLFGQLVHAAANVPGVGAARRGNGNKPVFGLPCGPKGLYHRFFQGYLLPSFTGGQITTFRGPEAVQAWQYMAELWAQTAPASTNFDNMQEPLQRGEVLIAWDHVARLVNAPADKPDDWLMVPAPRGPKGLGYLLVAAGLGIPKGAPELDRARQVIEALTTPDVQLEVLRRNAFFPVVGAELSTDLPPAIALEAEAVRRQQSAQDAVLALPPVGLGARDGEVSQIFKNCFKEICLDRRPVQQVLDRQAQELNKILDEVKVPCWRPDPVAAGQPCRVR